MKFETIKDKAKQSFCGAMDQWPFMALNGSTNGSNPVFEALLPFVLATKGEREEMRLFAEAFEANKRDWIAGAAKAQEGNRIDVAWSQTVLRAREAGIELINRWDVRMVGKLVELFPDSIPAKYRNRPMNCYMADNEACDWMVEFDDAPSDRDRQRPRG